ncbi:hypothetical protein [Desertivirga xinjiangensis]|uniref:hypothetical protein n=1 Tax=Desertivirga xinjiangensis TaxID=539206 RepID=UPI002109535A|nr:hypothetical protein [Pedobacter xinjiangensis]
MKIAKTNLLTSKQLALGILNQLSHELALANGREAVEMTLDIDYDLLLKDG